MDNNPRKKTQKLNMAMGTTPQSRDDFEFECGQSWKLRREKMWEAYEKGLYVDVTLVVGNHKFRVHRNVMYAASTYFESLFSDSFVESQSDEISIKYIEVDSFRLVLRYIYTGHITLNMAVVSGVVHAACFFDLCELKDACDEFLKLRVDNDNIFMIMSLADRYFLVKVRKYCIEFVSAKAGKLLNSPESGFLDLDIHLLEIFLVKDDLNVKDEKDVACAVLKWIERQKPRETVLLRAVKTIRLTQLDPVFIKTNILECSLVQSAPSVRSLVENFYWFLACGFSLNGEAIEHLPRPSTGVRMQLVCLGKTSRKTSKMTVSHLMNGKPQNEPKRNYLIDSPFDYDCISSCVAEGCLYVSGVGRLCKEIWVYKPKVSGSFTKWTKITDLNHPRRSHVMTPGYKGTVYIFGGYEQGIDDVLQVEQLLLSKGQCEVNGQLCLPTECGVFYNGKIVSFATRNKASNELSLELYDCSANSSRVYNLLCPEPIGLVRKVVSFHSSLFLFTAKEAIRTQPQELLQLLSDESEITIDSSLFQRLNCRLTSRVFCGQSQFAVCGLALLTPMRLKHARLIIRVNFDEEFSPESRYEAIGPTLPMEFNSVDVVAVLFS